MQIVDRLGVDWGEKALRMPAQTGPGYASPEAARRQSPEDLNYVACP
jgi:hypothetical protein